MALGFGKPYGINPATDKVDIGTFTIPTEVTYFVWHFQEKSFAGFSKILSRGGGVHEIQDIHDQAGGGGDANNYGFGNRSTLNYYRWAVPDGDRRFKNNWVPLGISVDTSADTNVPTVYHRGIKRVPVRVGTGAVYDVSSQATVLGNHASIPSSTFVWAGMLAEFAMWNVILSEQEHMLLQQGYSPVKIRPGNLLHYVPMRFNGEDIIAGAGVATSTRVFPHPPQLYSGNKVLKKYFLNASTANSYTITPSGSVNLSGTNTMSVQKFYTLAASGTINLSGNNALTPLNNYIFTNGGTITLSGANALTYTSGGGTTYNMPSSGTISLSGANALTPTYSTTYNMTSSGTITLSGANALVKTKIMGASGTINLSGSNAISSNTVISTVGSNSLPLKGVGL